MAEAVGFVSSIIAILDLSGKVVQFLKSVKDAREDRKRLLNEVVNASSLLSLIQSRLDGGQGSSKNSTLEAVKLLFIPEGPLKQIQSLLQYLIRKLQPRDNSGIKRLKEVVWPFKDAEYRDIIHSLERYKTCLLLAIQNDHLELSQEIKDNLCTLRDDIWNVQNTVTELSNGVEEVNRGIRSIKESQNTKYQEEQNQQILEWLSPLTFWSKQKEILESRQEGTGLWVLENPIFEKWVLGDHKTLFCSGIPGAGKTVVSSIIIDYVDKTYSQDNPSVAVVYLYCSYNEQSQQTTVSLMGSLLRQLVSKLLSFSSEPPDEVTNLHYTHASTSTHPSLNDYTNVIRKIAKLFSRIYLIIDALDECGQSYELLETIYSLLSLETISFLATSRHMKDLDEFLEGVPQLEICADARDVRKYLNSQIQKRPRLMAHTKKNSGLAEEIIDTITIKAQGMFLLAHLHFDTIATKHTVRKIREALQALPQGLDDTYNHAMKRISDQNEDDYRLAMRVLTWITCASGPLSTKVLQCAVAIEPDMTDLDGDDLPAIDLMVSVCAGLVCIEFGTENDFFRLVHYTAQEYFIKHRERFFPRAHSEIASTLLTYLSFDMFDEGPLVDRLLVLERQLKHPLFAYAANTWGNYVREQADPHVKQQALEYMHESAKFASTVELVFHRFRGNRYLSRQAEIDRVMANAKGIFMAAHFGMEDIFMHIVENEKPSLTLTSSCMQTPLIMASKNGRDSMVQLLLGYEEVCRSIDQKDIDGRTALSWAAHNGHDTTLALLLQHNAHPDERDRAGRSPLSLAACQGQFTVVKTLLTISRVDSNSRDKGGWTALLWAARLGRMSVLQILLEQGGVNCETSDVEGRTPLSWAAGAGEEAIVELLLSRKEVNPDSRDNKYGRTPLARAAENGHLGIIRLLLARPDVNPNQADFDGQTPLLIATRFGREDVVRILLGRQDVDPNVKSKGGRTPLYWAARKGYDSVVALLLNHKNVNRRVKDEYGHNPMAWALMNGHTKVVELFSAQGPGIALH